MQDIDSDEHERKEDNNVIKASVKEEKKRLEDAMVRIHLFGREAAADEPALVYVVLL